MMLRILSPSLAAALALTAAAQVAPVEHALRSGHPAEALRLLENGSETLRPDEAAYWKAQALARLGRTEEAAELFYSIPPNHPLYPYAARGILYCAWVDAHINFVEVCAPLTASAHPEVAELALAALAEYQLRYTRQGDTSTLSQLEKLAATRPELEPLVKLLTIHRYRHTGAYDKGLEYARALEHEADLPLAMRQRVRLEISELYYDKEKAGQDASPDSAEESDEGKGEETLLQFITANPDSPLLSEAFRRLEQHGALSGSEYTLTRLHEWAEDSAHAHRAALALRALQMQAEDSSALASRAASQLPLEPLTLSIVHEQLRRLLSQGKEDQVELYRSLLKTLEEDGASPRSLFADGQRLWKNPAIAADLFRRSAVGADGALRPIALANSLICSLRAGDDESVRILLSAPASHRTRRELLMAHVACVANTAPELALQELDEVMRLNPTPTQATDVLLDRALISLKTNPSGALSALQQSTKEERLLWSDEQILRYAALLEQAATRAQQPALPLLYALFQECESLAQKEALALHIADAYSAEGNHKQALRMLLELADLQPIGDRRAATLLYAAHASAAQGTLPALEHAVRLFAESALQGDALFALASISQAAVLVRINRASEASDILYNVRQNRASLTAEEQAFLHTVQADAYGMQYTPEDLDRALEQCEKITLIPQLPRAWLSRALLQHASFCARRGNPDAAYCDYCKVMNIEKAQLQPPVDKQSSFVFYYAGAGAVYQLLQMERFSEAASLAQEIAVWPSAEHVGPKSEAFARWAQSIRQAHYLPAEP